MKGETFIIIFLLVLIGVFIMTGIVHKAVKVSGEKGLATEWNDDHEITGNIDVNQNQFLNNVIENKTDFPAGPVEGQVVWRSDSNAFYIYNGTDWISLVSQQPIGSVTAWLKSFPNTPALSWGWVECNGQVLDDTESVYHGETIPNLNAGHRFLRGSSTSGATGGSETHRHSIITPSYPNRAGAATGVPYDTLVWSSYTSTLPSYYEVVWVMRVK